MQESTKKVMCMKQTEIILDMMAENNGTITTAQITAAGISKSSLYYLLEQGLIDRSERGVYILPEVWDDEMFNIQQKYRKGIYSLDTALFLNNLTDRTPNKFQMTFPISYNIGNIDRSRVVANRVKEEWHEVGVTIAQTPGGNTVRCYNNERTLCDILKMRNKTDIQLISEGFKSYVNKKEKNIILLTEYGKLFGVEKKLRSYLEVLL